MSRVYIFFSVKAIPHIFTRCRPNKKIILYYKYTIVITNVQYKYIHICYYLKVKLFYGAVETAE